MKTRYLNLFDNNRTKFILLAKINNNSIFYVKYTHLCKPGTSVPFLLLMVATISSSLLFTGNLGISVLIPRRFNVLLVAVMCFT